MENLGQIINLYLPLESVLSNISYDSSRLLQWTCAVLGAFLVGLSGLVPLLIMPATNKRKKSISHKDTNDTVCPRPHENNDDHSRSRRKLFSRSISHKDTNDRVCPRLRENNDDHNRLSRTLFRRSISHKDTHDRVCPRPHENGDGNNRSSRTLFRRQCTVEHFSQMYENEDDQSQQNNELTLNRYLSFAVGGLLGDICLHLLPEIYSEIVDSTIIYDEGRQLRLGLSILTGILSFLAIEKLFDVTQVINYYKLL